MKDLIIFELNKLLDYARNLNMDCPYRLSLIDGLELLMKKIKEDRIVKEVRLRYLNYRVFIRINKWGEFINIHVVLNNINRREEPIILDSKEVFS